MANHAHAKLPWAVDERLMELLAAEALKAVFGDYYRNEGALSFAQRLGWNQGESAAGSTQVWAEGPRHVEMRHGCNGLDALAQRIEFQALAGCFGAEVFWDDGWTDTPEPGRQKLNLMRRFHAGFGEEEVDHVGNISFPMWLLSPRQERAARAACDPQIFRRRRENHKSPGAEADVLDWGSKIDWAAAVEARWPDGEGMSAAMARAALSPSAALGLPCHGPSLAKAGRLGLEKALSLAIFWGRAQSALEILERLKATSPAPKESLEAAWERCVKKAIARSGGEADEGRAQASHAVFEALALDLEASAPRAKRSKASL